MKKLIRISFALSVVALLTFSACNDDTAIDPDGTTNKDNCRPTHVDWISYSGDSSTFELKYDSKGNMTEVVLWDYDMYRDTANEWRFDRGEDIYTYDGDGKLVKILFRDNRDYEDWNSYYYDGDRLTRLESISNRKAIGDTSIIKYRFAYEGDHITKIYWASVLQGIDEYLAYELEWDGDNVVKMKTLKEDGSVVMTWSFGEYKDHDNVISIIRQPFGTDLAFFYLDVMKLSKQAPGRYADKDDNWVRMTYTENKDGLVTRMDQTDIHGQDYERHIHWQCD